ncbi:protein stoned-A isoform X1 [Lucilia sericata]|uniref:protein stoned-A isoform X1 n=1 Tax=Lucilia sericata TaxID=13632 RepID=UPI0018A87F4C|nr:protein stoned-A isoform X1 [Lucilia sericata]XP_037818809.1 protein stoned-A isoform X1 [Lucilia sericata]XP_037818810.1 protein stoned-A isoform X1 [Lucilia sericata]
MLKLPKGLKKKKKKSKKDQELFTEEELEEYKRQLKAKQEAAAAKSDAGESDAASDVEGLAPTATTSNTASTSELASANTTSSAATVNESAAANGNGSQKATEDDEWAKFKALTSGVDTILHKTQDELDRIKKESFYQRLPSAAEKKKQEEEEAAKREAERLEEEKRKAAELEAQRDKLAEAVVELSESEGEDEAEVDDIFVTEYVDAITSGELQLVVPDSPVLDFDDGPDPFDTAYAEKVIVGADKAKGNKKLVSLGAAVEVLSGRVEREKALELAKPKRKLRKGIKNLLLSESIDQGDLDEEDLLAPEPQRNLLDELVDDVPIPDAPIDLSVSLHLSFIQPKKPASDEEEENENQENSGVPDLSEFDTLKSPEDDEFAELAAESLNKKEEVKVITEIPLPKAEVLTDFSEADWAEFEQLPEEQQDNSKKPPPRPTSGPHLVEGAIYISDDEEEQDDDPFNTSYAEQVIKKTTVLEEDDDFDPRAEEKSAPPARPPPPTAVKIIAKHLNVDIDSEDFDPFDTTVAGAVIVLSKTTLKQSLSDPDFDPRAEESSTEPEPQVQVQPTEQPASTPKIEEDFDAARRKSSLSLSLQNNKSVGFLVPNQDLLGASEGGSNKKPLTPYYAPSGSSIAEKEAEDPFDTSYVPENKPTDVELKHLESDLLSKPTLKHSLSDPDFDPRAPPTPVPAEDLLAVKENINTKVLTPAQESKDLPDYSAEKDVDPFDTSIAANLQPGQAELKLLESELLPERKSDIHTGVLDTQSDAQELGLGDKVLTPQFPHKQIVVPVEVDPFDTSIAENLQPGETEIKLLESELIEH